MAVSDTPQVSSNDWKPCSSEHQQEVSWVLASAYLALTAVCLLQLVRCQLLRAGRMQKGFHALLLLNNAVRFVFFGLLAMRGNQSFPGGMPVNLLLNILPDSLFFTTFCLLVMFWATIFYKAKNRPIPFLKKVRFFIKSINVIVYIIQFTFWGLLSFAANGDSHILFLAFHIHVVLLCLLSVAGFVLFGGKLFTLLRQFPIQSTGQRERLLWEVGTVTVICCCAFSLRAAMLVAFLVRSDASLDFAVCGAYFGLVEIIPSALVLIIFRRMPRRAGASKPDSLCGQCLWWLGVGNTASVESGTEHLITNSVV